MKNLSTRYNPQEVENKWFDYCKSKGFYHAEVIKDKEPYSIVIPPPNVTGILHMGHALNNIIQDILIRYKRMSGFNAEWTPGTDHAGIATQNVVEKELSKENKTRYDLGRDKFIDEVWQWTKINGGTIIEQLKRLGCSCDWQRERFTLDENYSKAVNEAFIRLYKDKLIYRGSYIINWCPRCKTALSDEEAPHKEIQGNLYYIKYPLKQVTGYTLTGTGKSQVTSKNKKSCDRGSKTPDYVVVATTRPETMFGDTALCVNPKDKRYKHLVGKIAILPIVNRELKIIEDDIVDPEFGTGIVKVTPLHDANDFELGNRHNLDGILCINTDGTMNINATEEYSGMDRFEARESLIEDLRQRKLLQNIQPHTHSVGHCYRCHTMIEPYFSEQWFVKMKPLSKKALAVAKRGKIEFYPKRWLKIYINWMENIRDWCISRQIWWGHRIPVWYCKKCYDKYIKNKQSQTIRLPLKVSKREMGIAGVGEEPACCPYCKSKEIIQDPDVLDTWFSSWLWPFAVYGWPKKTEELSYFYPTSTLVTASEIIFFWVARMIIAGLYFMKDIPFHDVYIHGTVRDEKGRKMSKSLGNAIDPQEIIDKHGADALRFSLISLPGEDLYLSKSKFEFGRNFTNKIWNASRFILMNLDGSKLKLEDISLNEIKTLLTKDESHLAEEWILSKLNKLILDIDEDFKAYRFDEISKKLYDFFWHKFCDWYIEIAKVNIEDEITQKVLFITLKTILKLMHPCIPFITEEIWQKLPRKTEESIMISKWPEADKQFINSNKEEQFNECLIKPIRIVRNFRMNHKLNSSVTIPQIVIDTQELKLKNIIRRYEEHIKKLARVGIVNVLETVFEKPVTSSIIKVQIPLEGLIDAKKEKIRLNKEIDKKRTALKELNGKLSNKRYLENAPKSDVEETKKRKEECSLEIEGLLKSLEELG